MTLARFRRLARLQDIYQQVRGIESMSQSPKTRYIMVITMQIYIMMIVMQIYMMDERMTWRNISWMRG